MANNKGVKKIILKMVAKLRKEYQPEKIILFGSYAWGNPTKDSDVDLFIVKETNERHRDRAIRVRQILDKENGLVALEPLVYNSAEVNKRLAMGDSFIKGILTKGKTLYGE